MIYPFDGYPSIWENISKRIHPPVASAVVEKPEYDPDHVYAWKPANNYKGWKLIARGKAGVDDAEVIQSAIDASPFGGTVFIAAGEYIITKTIKLKNDLRLIGEGSYKYYPILKLGDNVNSNMFESPNIETKEVVHRVVMRGFQLDGNGDNQTNGSLIDGYFEGCLFEEITFKNPCQYGIWFRKKDVEAFLNVVRNCHFYTKENYGIKMEATDLDIVNCRVDGALIEMVSTTQLHIHGVRGFGYWTTPAIKIKDSYDVVITGNNFESAGGTMIRIEAGPNEYVSNILIASNSFRAWLLQTDNTVNCIDIYYDPNAIWCGEIKITGNMFLRRSDNGYKHWLYANKMPQSEITYNYFLGAKTKEIQVDDLTQVRIRGNMRYTTENSGTATFSGDGSTTQFSIEHGLVSTPSKVLVTPMSADAAGDFYVTADDTYIYINYKTAPPSGTDNIKVSFYAEV